MKDINLRLVKLLWQQHKLSDKMFSRESKQERRPSIRKISTECFNKKGRKLAMNFVVMLFMVVIFYKIILFIVSYFP